MFFICIISGCGDDSTTKYGEIQLLGTTPEDGGTISVSGELEMVFDGPIGGVTVDGMRSTIIADQIASMQIADLGEVTPGTRKTVTISWVNLDYSFVGTRTISFTLTPAPATTVEVDPPGGIIRSNTGFTLTFDQPVRAVAVNDRDAVGSARNWKVSPPLWQGSGSLDIIWVNLDGSRHTITVGPYTVEDNGGGSPPEITSWTVADGATDVDPVAINAGGIRINFTEPVAGTIKLTDEAGVDLNWISNVAGQTATLTAVAGRELVNETTYKIEIDVRDCVGHRLQVTITFVTKPE